MSLRHVQYLTELGITVYARRRAAGGENAPAERVFAETPADPHADGAAGTERAARVEHAAAEQAAAGLPARQRGTPIHGEPRAGTAVSPGLIPRDPDAWRALEAAVRDCTRCPLHRGRTQTVFGVGRRDASLLVVGEAPGEEEDRQGEPFVGPAGRLLNAMLRAIGLSREQVYIANILKCRPPGNRDPRPEEADACSEFLDRQIAMIEPRAMLAVGRVSAQRLLKSEQPVGRLRGVVHRYGPDGIPLIVTYHPAYLLRTPIAKAKSWQDLCMLMPLLASSAA